MKQIIIMLSIIIFVIISITLCLILDIIGTEEEGVEYLVGISFSNLSEIKQTSIYNAIMKNAEKDSKVNIVTTNASGSIYSQLKDLKKLQAMGVDVMLICADDELVIRNEIASYYGDIPIIILDKYISGYDYDLYLGIDNYELGYNVGMNIVETLDGESCTIVEIKDEINMKVTQERSKGFSDFLSGHDNIQLISFFITSNSSELDAKLESLYKNHDDIRAVFAHDIDIASKAQEVAQRVTYNDIYFSSFSNEDFSTKRGIEQLQKVNCIYTYNYNGSQIMPMIKDLADNKETVVKKNILNTMALTKDNMRWYFKNSELMSEQKKEITKGTIVGYVGNGVNSEYYNTINDMFNRYFKMEKIDFYSYMLTNNKEEIVKAQHEAVDKLIEDNADLIFLTPYDSVQNDELIKKARLNGVRVVLLDEPLSYSEQISLTYIGADGYDEGKLAAEWIVDHVYSNKNDIFIAEIKGRDNAFSTFTRENGFGNVINGYLRIEVVESVYGDCTYEFGANAMKQILENNSNVNLLYVHNQEMALGAIDVIKQNNMKPGEDIKIVINRGMSEAEKLLELGEVNCIIKQECTSAEYIIDNINNVYSGLLLNQRIILADKIISIVN